MGKASAGNRLIEPGSCSWCGHKPHAGGCGIALRTSTKEKDPLTPCPCKKRTPS